MDVAGEYTFDAPQEMVWDALQDPNVLGTIMPGGQGIEAVGDNEYKGMLHIKVGPVQGVFQGDIKLSNVVPPVGYHIDIDGKGAPGFVKAKGQLRLEARGQQTFMDYSGQANIGGRIASVGQRLIDSSARSIIRQSLDALNDYLKVQVAQQAVEETTTDASVPSTAEGTHEGHDHAAQAHEDHHIPTPVYRPPSQMGLALTVMRDVINDFIPPQYHPVVMGLLLVAIVLIVWYFASQ